MNGWKRVSVRAGYADETEHMVQQVTTLGMQRVAVMYQDDGFGKAGPAPILRVPRSARPWKAWAATTWGLYRELRVRQPYRFVLCGSHGH